MTNLQRQTSQQQDQIANIDVRLWVPARLF